MSVAVGWLDRRKSLGSDIKQQSNIRQYTSILSLPDFQNLISRYQSQSMVGKLFDDSVQ